MDKTMRLATVSRLALGWLILGASGCFQAQSAPLAAMTPPGGPEYEAVTGLPTGTGQLRIAIKWPGRTTQGIPLSARKLKFRIKQGAAEKAYREVDQTTTTTAFNLRAGAYDLEVGAHPGTVDSVDYSGTEIAGATSSVVVYSSVVTTAGMALEPRFAPQLGSVDLDSLSGGSNFALPGGSNFKPAWTTDDPVISFPTGGGTGTATASVTFPGGVPTFAVPAGADTAGAFTITQDGMSKSFPYSQGANVLFLAKSLTFSVAGTSDGQSFTAPIGQGGSTCTFSAAGTWRDCSTFLCPSRDANGNTGTFTTFSPAGIAVPITSLILKKGSGGWQFMGKGPRSFQAASGQGFTFMMNDANRDNNLGSQTVTYTCTWNKTGTLAVDADAVNGTPFRVPARSDLACTFSVLGNQKWSHVSGGTADLDADGIPVDSTGAPTGAPATVANGTYRLSGANAGALIVKRGDNSYEPAGKSRSVAVTSGELLQFLINDVSTGYGSNPGSVTIDYSCNPGTFGNANVSVQ